MSGADWDARVYAGGIAGIAADPPGEREYGGYWQSILDGLSASVAIIDGDGTIVATNRAWKLFALANDGHAVGVGADYLAVCDAAVSTEPLAGEVAAALRGMLDGTIREYATHYPCHGPGTPRWFSLRANVIASAGVGAGPRHVMIFHEEGTEGHLAQARVEEQAELLDAAGSAITAVDLDGVITHWSAGAERLLGWAPREVLGREILAVLRDSATATTAQGTLESGLNLSEKALECQIHRRDGTLVHVGIRTHGLRDPGGRLRGLIAVWSDLTERREADRDLLAAGDFLATVMAAVPDGLMTLDAEGRVTLVNDAAETLLGWTAADLVGQQMHTCLHALTADGRPRSEESSVLTACNRAGTPVRVDDDVFQRRDGTLLPVRFSATSLGGPAAGGGVVIVFADITESKARELQVRQELEALSWVGRIRDALDEDRLRLFAQPIIRLSDGETIGHELLVRMISVGGDVIAPGNFLPVAEQHGLIAAIDRRVFTMALDLVAEGHPVCINLSADSISDPSTFRFVQEQVAARGVAPQLITFEITETALIHNESVAQAFIENVRRLECAVALDDFGTGYGSFRYLKHLPVTMLKIDQDFVRDLDGGAAAVNRHVIGAIVTLARGMGQTTVAEGVESATALEQLRDLGVDFAQGYLFAHPKPLDDVFPNLSSGVRP